jgi:hypothetical protein
MNTRDDDTKAALVADLRLPRWTEGQLRNATQCPSDLLHNVTGRLPENQADLFDFVAVEGIRATPQRLYSTRDAITLATTGVLVSVGLSSRAALHYAKKVRDFACGEKAEFARDHFEHLPKYSLAFQPPHMFPIILNDERAVSNLLSPLGVGAFVAVDTDRVVKRVVMTLWQLYRPPNLDQP